MVRLVLPYLTCYTVRGALRTSIPSSALSISAATITITVIPTGAYVTIIAIRLVLVRARWADIHSYRAFYTTISRVAVNWCRDGIGAIIARGADYTSRLVNLILVVARLACCLSNRPFGTSIADRAVSRGHSTIVDVTIVANRASQTGRRAVIDLISTRNARYRSI